MSFFNFPSIFKKVRSNPPNDEDSNPKSSDQDLTGASKRRRQVDCFIEASEEQEKLIENLTSERYKLSEEKSEQEKLIENLTSERDKLSEEKSEWIEDKAKLEEELQR